MVHFSLVFRKKNYRLPKSIRLKMVVTMSITTVIAVLVRYLQKGTVNRLKATEICPQQLLLEQTDMRQSTDDHRSTEDPHLAKELI